MTLSDRDMEALGILQEECAEIIQAISKIRRSGPNYRPFDGDKTNLQLLAEEIGDFQTVLFFCPEEAKTFPDEHIDQKIAKLRKWSSIVPD